jgi:putative ribosome biogenesis GTPase RsgA
VLLILNKDRPAVPNWPEGLAEYARLSYEILALSTHMNTQLPAALAGALRDQTTVLAGRSGSASPR